MKQYDTFSTHDLALASALATQGFSIADMERSEYSRRVSFIFERTEGLDKAVEDYWSDNLKVNPKTYFDALKHIKTRIYARN